LGLDGKVGDDIRRLQGHHPHLGLRDRSIERNY
jgi:hypothetical protein